MMTAMMAIMTMAGQKKTWVSPAVANKTGANLCEWPQFVK